MAGAAAGAPTLASVADALLGYVSEDVQADLRFEDPAAAVELHFSPVACQPLPSNALARGSCSIDGFYESEVDVRPWIFFAEDVHEHRVRFTILHELGHHLLATSAAVLLDDIDTIRGSTEGGAVQAEEAICHRFAGNLLIPDELVVGTIGSDRTTPSHVVVVHEACEASWEAVAVRVAEVMTTAGAVVLLRDHETVSFCAASSRMGSAWWPRGSRIDPNGPLARGLSVRQTAVAEQYRFGLAYPRAMFCDTIQVHAGLAIGVLSDKPSDGSLSIIEEVDPAWKDRAQFCEWHPGVERDVGWCFKCKGMKCPECWRCGCGHPVKNPMCPECKMIKPFRDGAAMCRDCEIDLG